MGPYPVDHAHVFEVSAYPGYYTNDDNVYLVCRGAHRRLDDWQDPVTGKPSDKSTHWYWWWRVINASTAKYDEGFDYEDAVRTKCLATTHT